MAPRLSFCTHLRSSHGELGSRDDLSLSQNYFCNRLETSVYKPWSKPLPRGP